LTLRNPHDKTAWEGGKTMRGSDSVETYFTDASLMLLMMKMMELYQ
jgi:hypothetical protein